MSVRLDHGEDTLNEVHEINVTPFIDVMLVLLIIFMVAAPLATVDIQVNLPASTAEPQQRPDKPLYLTVKSDLTLALGNDPVNRHDPLGFADGSGGFYPSPGWQKQNSATPTILDVLVPVMAAEARGGRSPWGG